MEVLKGAGIGGEARFRCPRLGHPEFLEEHGLKLFGRAQVDFVTDDGKSLCLSLSNRLCQALFQGGKSARIDRNTFKLHPGKDRQEGEFNLGGNRLAARIELCRYCSPCLKHKPRLNPGPDSLGLWKKLVGLWGRNIDT